MAVKSEVMLLMLLWSEKYWAEWRLLCVSDIWRSVSWMEILSCWRRAFACRSQKQNECVQLCYISCELQMTRTVYWSCACLCVCLSLAACPHCCMHPDVTWGNGRGSRYPLVVHYWADLQSVHVFCCNDNVAWARDVSECLYLLYAWLTLLIVVDF